MYSPFYSGEKVLPVLMIYLQNKGFHVEPQTETEISLMSQNDSDHILAISCTCTYVGIRRRSITFLNYSIVCIALIDIHTIYKIMHHQHAEYSCGDI